MLRWTRYPKVMKKLYENCFFRFSLILRGLVERGGAREWNVEALISYFPNLNNIERTTIGLLTIC